MTEKKGRKEEKEFEAVEAGVAHQLFQNTPVEKAQGTTAPLPCTSTPLPLPSVPAASGCLGLPGCMSRRDGRLCGGMGG